ncbi:MAG: dienelactone hydrolase family protein [Vicinamibacterales bacterium]
MADPALEGYQQFTFAAAGPPEAGEAAISHLVYHRGDGPAVLILHELPGLSPAALRFGRRLADRGFHCYLPLLFGEPGQHQSMASYRRLCISREFARLQSGVSAPIVDWLRRLAADISSRHGGASIGAIGMCLTGAFAIPLVLERCVTAPVVAQPGIPFSFTFSAVGMGRGAWMSQLNIADADLEEAAVRARTDGITLMATRFRRDRVCPAARIDRVAQAFGDHMVRRELDGGSALRPPHATLTEEYERAPDAPTHPTRVLFEELVAFLHARLDRGRVPEAL